MLFFEEPKMYIEYTFTMDDGKILNYRIDFERSPPNAQTSQNYPKWTALSFQQCRDCPLHPQEHQYCPVATDGKDIIMGFRDILSCSSATVQVKTPEREYFKHCDAQTGLRALIGFVMATSSCPILSKMRGMAHYHLPFASIEEIVYRTASSYLLSQYFVHRDGGQADLDLNGLKQYFDVVKNVNYDFLQRIRVASEADSNLDVLATLFSISSFMSADSLDEHLEKMRPLFNE